MRAKNITEVEEIFHTQCWWGTSIEDGIEILFSRLLNEIKEKNIESFNIKWRGKDKVYISVSSLGEEHNCEIQLDGRIKNEVI